MQFLAPLWLAIGAAAAVPLFLHLWNRRRAGERVLFPAVRLLAAATEARGAAIRLREWLLLALRVLAVVLIAAAAARPAVRGVVGSRAPIALALVLDNSLSTSAVVRGRSVLDGLRAELRTALAATRPGDRVWVLTADGAVVAGDPRTAAAALDAVRPFAGAGDVPGALRRAAALVTTATRTQGGGGGAVVVATDAQATTWARPLALANVRVGIVRAPDAAPPDRGVLSLASEPVRWSPDGTVVGRLTAVSDWHLVLRDSAGRTVADSRGVAEPADGFGVRVALRPAARGWLTGTLELPPDELRGDDVRHLALYVGAPAQLVADPSAGTFAALGVATLAEGGGLAGAGTVNPSAPRVTEPQARTRLPAVLVAPSDPTRVPAANLALERLGVPWRLGARADAPVEATFRAPRRGEATTTTARPVPATLGPASPTASAVPVLRRWRLESRAGARAAGIDTVASTGGEPWIVAGSGYVLLASPLDTSWTPFPARAAFVPWLASSATALADPAGVVTRPQVSAPGAPLNVPGGIDALLGPAGTRAVREPRIDAPTQPGVYYWLRAGARVGALVIDPEADEVLLARLDPRALRDRVRVTAGGAVDVSASGTTAADFAFGAGGRRSLATLLAAGALLLLAGEAFAARARPA